MQVAQKILRREQSHGIRIPTSITKRSIIMKKLSLIIFAVFLTQGIFAQLDRSVVLKPKPLPTIQLEDAKKFKLKNGLTVLVVESDKLPTVSMGSISIHRQSIRRS